MYSIKILIPKREYLILSFKIATNDKKPLYLQMKHNYLIPFQHLKDR